VAQVPIATRGAFKISDNESPQPQDRLYLNYNFFNAAGIGMNRGLLAAFRQGNSTLANDNGDTIVVPFAYPRVRLHSYTFGMEKTMPWNPDVSFGLRIPIFDLYNNGGIEDDTVDNMGLGDITMILKAAISHDAATGNALSAGLAVTVPTGPAQTTIEGHRLETTLIQPFVGLVYNFGDLYFHGFTAIVFPASINQEPVVWNNDIGVGYWAYRSGYWFLSGVVPTLEAHFTNPLEEFDQRKYPIVRVPDSITLTWAVNFVFGQNSTLGLGVATPITGPKIYDYEMLAQLNWRF
jgi:hypothetical protein